MSQTQPLVSVIIPVLGPENGLKECLDSVLNNSWKNLEAIIVNDGDDLSTKSVIRAINDPRVKLISKKRVTGAGGSRNSGAEKARGEFLFFIDADCAADSDWISAGMKILRESGAVGVEGAINYENIHPRVWDKIPINPLYNLRRITPINNPARDFAAANIAYQASVFREMNGYDVVRFPNGREDTDLGMRIQTRGKIDYDPRMKVTHRSAHWSVRKLMRNASRYQADVEFLKRHNFFLFKMGPLIHPQLFLSIFFPLWLVWLLAPAIRSLADVIYIVPFYMYVVVLRFHIWRAAWEKKVFVI